MADFQYFYASLQLGYSNPYPYHLHMNFVRNNEKKCGMNLFVTLKVLFETVTVLV